MSNGKSLADIFQGGEGEEKSEAKRGGWFVCGDREGGGGHSRRGGGVGAYRDHVGPSWTSTSSLCTPHSKILLAFSNFLGLVGIRVPF